MYGAHVCAQAGAIGKRSGAQLALESLNLVMHIHVTYVVTPHSKSFTTDVAVVGVLLEVHTVNVTLESCQGGEYGITHLALHGRTACSLSM
jgi:hypothetical protein